MSTATDTDMTEGSETVPETAQGGEEGMPTTSATEPQEVSPEGMFVNLSNLKQQLEHNKDSRKKTLFSTRRNWKALNDRWKKSKLDSSQTQMKSQTLALTLTVKTTDWKKADNENLDAKHKVTFEFKRQTM